VKAKPMKVELNLPEIPGYEYTGEYRPFAVGEFYYDEGGINRATWNSSSHYPIVRAKAKPKILLYQWLVNHNTNNDGDEKDCGYRICVTTEDHMVGMCKEFGWTCKKFSPSPLWSLDGDTL
jgi:hypothetical protein